MVLNVDSGLLPAWHNSAKASEPPKPVTACLGPGIRTVFQGGGRALVSEKVPLALQELSGAGSP